MRCIIAGSRDITDRAVVDAAVSASGFDITTVVSGGAKGVDTLGEEWARDHGIPIDRFDADWDGLGKLAGPYRNSEMSRNSSAAIVIMRRSSPTPGSTDMARRAKSEGLFLYLHWI